MMSDKISIYRNMLEVAIHEAQTGLEVIDLRSDKCITMLGNYIQANPEIWHKDIGDE